MQNLEPLVVAYGMGVNSTAALVGLHARGMRPDLILCADTGGERPETYAYRDVVSAWCESVGFPEIITVRRVNREQKVLILEQLCLDKKMLPSIAYGYKSCSDKFKRQPQDKFVNNWEPARKTWAAGGKVIKLIGYDADEPHRAARVAAEDEKYRYWYPLISWGWGRDECVQQIAKAGLPPAHGSACFFCPSMTKPEILQLQADHPDLLTRALAMESNAELDTVKGLGRRFAWADFIANPKIRGASVETTTPCGCYDGG